MSRTRRTAASQLTRTSGTRRQVYYQIDSWALRRGPSSPWISIAVRCRWPADGDEPVQTLSWGPMGLMFDHPVRRRGWRPLR